MLLTKRQADDFLWRSNLNTLQALVLLVYALNHAHGQAWALLGLTYNIALSLGCHIDPAGLNLSAVECEERRRVWAGLMMLQTIQSTCLGGIAPQQIACQVRLPADVNDEDVAATTYDTQIQLLGHAGAPTQMTYILYKFRLYKLATEICQLNYTSDRPDHMTVMDLHRRIAAEQEEHSARFFDVQSLPLHHIVHHHILISYTNQLYLMLHRPILAEGNHSDMAEDVEGSFRQCETSAMAILDIHELVHNTPEFKAYQWYHRGIGSFHAFFASMVLSVLVRESRNVSQISVIQTALGKCVHRFLELSDRSSICKRAIPILGHLTGCLSPAVNEPFSPISDAARGSTFSGDHSEDDSTNSPWANQAQLGMLLTQMPPEQWLSPSSFSWDYLALPSQIPPAGSSTLLTTAG